MTKRQITIMFLFNSMNLNCEFYKITKKFDSTTDFIIDSSSLIYLHKSQFSQKSLNNINIFTIKEVINEIKFFSPVLHIIPTIITKNTVSTDDKILATALKNKIPLISEDKKLLLKAQKNNLDYYNSAIFICFLLYKKNITYTNAKKYLERIFTISRYSNHVKNFSQDFMEYIKKIILT